MSKKFKVGDVVTVRSDVRAFRYYRMDDGSNIMCMTEQQEAKAGKTVKIKSITKTGKYMIEGSIFPWVDEMFEPEVVKVTKTKKRNPEVGDRIRLVKFAGGFDLVEETPKWKLVITGDGDTTTAEYVSPDGETVRRTVKRYHFDPFDVRAAVAAVTDKVLPVKKVEPAEYTVVGVVFEKGGQVYNYLANGLKVKSGMVVKVPVGKNNNLTLAVVKSVKVHTLKSSPYPISKMKNVAEIEDLNGWKFVCTESNHSFWTKGKIYPVKNGEIYDDEGDFRTLIFQFDHNAYVSPKELNLCGTHLIKVTE